MFNTQKLFEEGLPNPENAVNALSWFNTLYVDKKGDLPCISSEEDVEGIPTKKVGCKKDKDGNPKVDEYPYNPYRSVDYYETIINDFNTLEREYTFTKEGISKQEFNQRFWIGWKNMEVVVPSANDTGSATKHSSTGIPPWLLMKRIMMDYFYFPIGDFFRWLSKMIMKGAEISAKASNPVGQASLALEAAQALAGQKGKGPGAALSGLLGGTGSNIPSARTTLTGLAGAVPGLNKVTSALGNQTGGARPEPMSTDSIVLAATLMALIGGGAIKGIVDYMVPQED
jgi:hypothetical protein